MAMLCSLLSDSYLVRVNAREIFQKISYLQYPLMFIAIGFALMPYIEGFDQALFYLNYTLVFLGLGISFSTLQDTTKTQNKISLRIWQDPAKARVLISGYSIITLLTIIVGIIGMFSAPDRVLSEISLGLIVLGIGMLGMLKSMIEMFENHRKDKNPI